MIVEPELRIADFAKAGADIISVHAEPSSTIHLHRTLAQIKELGCLAGAVLNPGTSLSAIDEVLELCDLVLIMSVNPGFGGQKFINSQIAKIRALRQMCNERVCLCSLSVDSTQQIYRLGGSVNYYLYCINRFCM